MLLLSYETLSLGEKIHKLLFPYGCLRGLNSSPVTEVTEGRNIITTSWIFSHATEAGNLVVEGTLTKATRKVFIV